MDRPARRNPKAHWRTSSPPADGREGNRSGTADGPDDADLSRCAWWPDKTTRSDRAKTTGSPCGARFPRPQWPGRPAALLQPGQHVGRAGDSFQRRVDHEEDEDRRGGGEREPEQREVSVHVRYLLGRGAPTPSGVGAPFGGYLSSPKEYGSAALQAISRWAKRVRRKANSRRPWVRRGRPRPLWCSAIFRSASLRRIDRSSLDAHEPP